MIKVKAFVEKQGKRMILVINKAHIKQYQRRTKSGKIVYVREHEDSRGQHMRTARNHAKPMSLKQGSYIIDLLGFSQFREIKKEFLKHFNPVTGWTDLSARTASQILTEINRYWDNPKIRKIVLLKIQKLF